MSDGLVYMLDRAGATLAEMERRITELNNAIAERDAQLAEAVAQIEKLDKPSEVRAADA